MPRRRQYRKRKNGRRKATTKKHNKYSKIQTMRVRQPGAIVADRMYVKLRYTDTTSLVLATAGNPYGYLRYFSNGLHDANPLILTTLVPGFTELMALYSTYRVRGCKIRLTMCNDEAFPSNVVVWPSNQDDASNVTYQYLQTMLDNPYSRYRTLSAKGGMDRATITSYISFKKLLGSNNINTDIAYTGNAGNNPAALFYWHIGSYSMTGANYTSQSIPFECRLTFYCELFDRITVTT